MRGKHLHNAVLLAPVIAALHVVGLLVVEEAALPNGCGAVDLLIEDASGRRLVIEAETGAKRVRWAVLKAVHLGATTLVVLTPDGRTAKNCKAALRRPPRLDRLPQLSIFVLTYGALWARLASFFPELTGPSGRERK